MSHEVFLVVDNPCWSDDYHHCFSTREAAQSFIDTRLVKPGAFMREKERYQIRVIEVYDTVPEAPPCYEET